MTESRNRDILTITDSVIMFWRVNMMTLFEKISEDKRRTILHTAFSCFGNNGYRKTSIADIAKDAGISKASIFQYFGTKKELYLYLYQFAIGMIKDELAPGSDDVFECLKVAAATKIRVMSRFPGMFDFLASTVKEDDSEALAILNNGQRYNVLAEKESYYKHVNWAKLKPGIDKAMLMNMLNWINEGYLRNMPAECTTEEKVAEGLRYVEVIRAAVYREEYLI